MTFDLLPDTNLEHLAVEITNIGLGPALNVRFQLGEFAMRYGDETTKFLAAYNIDTGKGDSLFIIDERKES